MSNFIVPESLDQALEARREHPQFVVVAGGTDFMVASKDRKAPEGLISIFGIPEMSRIEEGENGGLRIGACTTYAALLADSRVTTRFRVLTAACREVGASQIQARGTLGGNVATSSPVGDSLPALLALGARIELASGGGTRVVTYDDFLLGYRSIDLRDDELIAAILLPAQHAEAVQEWRKVGTRKAQSISKVMMAAVARTQDGTIVDARIALGAVAATTKRLVNVEKAIIGNTASEDTAALAARVLAEEIHPIDDLRSNAAYRLKVAQNLVSSFIKSL